MSKWYCLDCKEYFDEPKEETSRYWSSSMGYDGTYEETICSCPVCGSEDIEEARDKCDACGETVYETKDVNGIYLCPECYEKLRDILEEAVMKVTGTFDKIDSIQARNLIRDFYEEE